MKCPTCSNGYINGIFAITRDGTRMSTLLPCPDCKGKGKIDDRHSQWKAIGACMKADRIARKLILREEAKRRNMSCSELSRMERGIIEPKEK